MCDEHLRNRKHCSNFLLSIKPLMDFICLINDNGRTGGWCRICRGGLVWRILSSQVSSFSTFPQRHSTELINNVAKLYAAIGSLSTCTQPVLIQIAEVLSSNRKKRQLRDSLKFAHTQLSHTFFFLIFKERKY